MKLTYRPEIDGLRAIAVGAVILYHAQIVIFGNEPFRGGFLGVDIFFVISGYLITSIIYKELVTTGSFSFKNFYERRIRRILPALLFVMLVSLPFAWLYLLPESFVDFSKSILYSLGFGSNFYFHLSGQQYGAESGFLKPFLHTWSLSIEEQYYILFPVVLLITFKYFKKYLIHILLVGFILSLGIADWTSRNYPSISFYFIHTRMWELIAGSMLAYFEITNGHRSQNRILNKILPFTGIILIGYSILFFSDEMFHPSFYSLSPVVGVCLIIWFSNENEIITKILSTKLFVGIGLISYSLYLWHYPIFAFARVTYFLEDNFVKELLSGVVILIVSIVSFYFIEKPFRNKKNQFKKLLIILFSLIVLLVSFNFYVINNGGFNKRMPEILQVELRGENVNFFQKDNTKKVVLIGDSHARMLENKLNEEMRKNDLSLFRFETDLYLKDFNKVDRKTKKIDKTYSEGNTKIDNFLEEHSDLIVIIHQRWSVYFLEKYFDNEEGFKGNNTYDDYYEPANTKTSSFEERQEYLKQGLLSKISKIVDQGHKLILVYPVPEMGFNVPNHFKNSFFRLRKLNNFEIPILTGSYDVYKKRNEFVFSVLDSAKDKNIYRVYPHKSFCDIFIKNKCVANDDKSIFYNDDDHLSLDGSKFVVNDIMKEIVKLRSKVD